MALRAMKRTSRSNKGAPMKTCMKSKKSKRISTVAKGRLARSLVFHEKRVKTVGGLKKDDLMKNKRGKIVSKRSAAQGKRHYKNVESWVECVMEAREALHCKGFVAINGKTLQGKALYVKAKSLRAPRPAVASATQPASPGPQVPQRASPTKP